ncbi:MAG: LemA family protein [Chitinophagales bacterium]|nr:LemA family protein [Chitinophagales bacterium]HAE13422.1 LemA family protein [Bacteroidota bacterium]MCB9020109.1 LemA family protein [Chitinophagales bacterium]MCB9021522.1 LemA family protein [Chitinophagales bacterium]MCB9032041.1 LemA family protein [Chitinophagales bacterium]
MFLLIPLILIFLYGVFLYNSLIQKNNQVENAFGQVDVILKKRFDLIPNLVETVRQYMTFEKDTLSRITELRSQLAGSPNMPAGQRIDTENELTRLLAGVRVAVENYPELKTNESFSMLQRTWNEVENQLVGVRTSYNNTVTTFNNAVEMFPSNIMAGWMNLNRKSVLVTADAERQSPNAKDLFKGE